MKTTSMAGVLLVALCTSRVAGASWADAGDRDLASTPAIVAHINEANL